MNSFNKATMWHDIMFSCSFISIGNLVHHGKKRVPAWCCCMPCSTKCIKWDRSVTWPIQHPIQVVQPSVVCSKGYTDKACNCWCASWCWCRKNHSPFPKDKTNCIPVLITKGIATDWVCCEGIENLLVPFIWCTEIQKSWGVMSDSSLNPSRLLTSRVFFWFIAVQGKCKPAETSSVKPRFGTKNHLQWTQRYLSHGIIYIQRSGHRKWSPTCLVWSTRHLPRPHPRYQQGYKRPRLP